MMDSLIPRKESVGIETRVSDFCGDAAIDPITLDKAIVDAGCVLTRKEAAILLIINSPLARHFPNILLRHPDRTLQVLEMSVCIFTVYVIFFAVYSFSFRREPAS